MSIDYRIVERQAFTAAGRSTWISGQDNELFGRFWQECREGGLFEMLEGLSGLRPGAQSGGALLGISCVEKDPACRAFHYLIGVEVPAGGALAGLEVVAVPAGQWAVFECSGPVPQGLVAAEMFAFMEWLPASGFIHAHAPEMEVYLPEGGEGGACEFWLPICPEG